MDPCARGLGSWIVHHSLWICCTLAVASAQQTEPGFGRRRRSCPVARLPLGTRKVLSSIDRTQAQGWCDASAPGASGVLLHFGPSDRGLIHRLFSGDGRCGNTSSSDVFLRLSGTPCIGAEARG